MNSFRLLLCALGVWVGLGAAAVAAPTATTTAAAPPPATATAGAPAAGTLKPAEIAALAGDDFDAKAAALDKLIAAARNDRNVLRLLAALQQESAYATAAQAIVIQAGDGYIDGLSGAPAAVKAEELQAVSLNNRLRARADSALAGLMLLSANPAERAKAIADLGDNPDPEIMPLVERALAGETDVSLKGKLGKIWAMLALQGEDRDATLKAIALLADSGDPQVAALLAPLQGRDPQVAAAASDALKALKKKQFTGDLLGNVIAGLSLGSVLLLAALGLAITYGLIGVINMAHGEFLMIGAYATYVVQSLFRTYAPGAIDWYLPAALPVAFLAAALVGVVLERLVLRHLYGRPLETLLATFGVSLLLIQATRALFGAQNVEVANPAWMSGGIQLLPNLTVPYNRIVIFVFSWAVIAMAWLVLNRTRLGLFVRAVTQNRTMASCVGVRTNAVDRYAFAFGAGIAGLGGVALSQIGNVGPDLGQGYIIDSFMAVVLGGVGQLAGTIVGAFGLGIVSKALEPFSGAVLAKICVLVLIVLFIQRRPQGMFALRGRSAEA